MLIISLMEILTQYQTHGNVVYSKSLNFYLTLLEMISMKPSSFSLPDNFDYISDSY